jgi:pyrroloquinoline quinone biosynthesis protein B
VLGVAQDGGAPHAGCTKECCEEKWNNPTQHARVSSIGIVDPVTKESWIIDATPDFAVQLTALDNQLSGIFLTHAHIGHYTGLIHLGREVMGAKEIPVYAMPRMKTFLESNGPWNQLVALNNISINEINDNVKITLNERLSITPFLVPHRDEYSETVGYKVEGPNKSLVFIPDIDKWQKWDQDIKEVVSNNTYSLLDGTFYDIDELPGRDMSEIPHPFIVETMKLLESVENKREIHFIHLNHTNPALTNNSNAHNQIKNTGFNIAQRGQAFKL